MTSPISAGLRAAPRATLDIEGDPSAPALALSLTRASLANALGLSILIHKMGITIQLHLPCRIVLRLKKTHHQVPMSSQCSQKYRS